MLVKSKLSSAPSSDRSSSAFSRVSRSVRSLPRSTRFSQSTAFWPKVWAILIELACRSLPPSRAHLRSQVPGRSRPPAGALCITVDEQWLSRVTEQREAWIVLVKHKDSLEEATLP